MRKLRVTESDLLKLASRSKYARRRIIEMAKIAVGDAFDEDVPQMNQQNAEMMQQQSQPDYYGNGVMPKTAVPTPTPGQPGMTPEEEQMMEQPIDNSPEAIGARAAQSFLGPEVMQMAAAGDPISIDLVSRVAGQIAKATAEMAMQNGGMGQGGGGMAGGMPPEGMQEEAPQMMTTPEEDLANEVVPPEAGQAPPQGAPPPQGNGNGGQPQNGNGNGGKPQNGNGGGNGGGNFGKQQNGNGNGGEKKPQNGNGKEFPPKKEENTKEASIKISTVKKLIKLARAGRI